MMKNKEGRLDPEAIRMWIFIVITVLIILSAYMTFIYFGGESFCPSRPKWFLPWHWPCIFAGY